MRILCTVFYASRVLVALFYSPIVRWPGPEKATEATVFTYIIPTSFPIFLDVRMQFYGVPRQNYLRENAVGECPIFVRRRLSIRPIGSDGSPKEPCVHC